MKQYQLQTNKQKSWSYYILSFKNVTAKEFFLRKNFFFPYNQRYLKKCGLTELAMAWTTLENPTASFNSSCKQRVWHQWNINTSVVKTIPGNWQKHSTVWIKLFLIHKPEQTTEETSIFVRYMRSKQDAADRILGLYVVLVHCEVGQVTCCCSGLTLAISQTRTLPFIHFPGGQEEQKQKNPHKFKERRKDLCVNTMTV